MSPPRSRASAHGAIGAAEALHGLVTAVVRRVPRDMSLTTGSTLSTLERTGPRRITDLAVIEGVTQPSMTTLVTRLEEAGLVQRDRDPLDGRVVRVAVTEAGSDYVRNRRRAMTDSFGELIDKLPPDEYAALEAAVPAMVHLQDLDGESRVTTRTAIQPGGHQ